MARLIAVTAFVTARASEAIHATSAFEVPEWDTDSIKLAGQDLKVWLSRPVRVEDGDDDMARAVEIAEADGVVAPPGWRIVEIDFFPHVDLGPAPEVETAPRPF